MRLSIYCTITGAKQGPFKGESPLTQHAQSIPCLGFETQVTVPFDQPTGLPSGKRTHQPIKVTKELGAASPQIQQACATNEVLTDVVFTFFHQTAAGEDEVVYTVKLTNARITGINQFTAPPHVARPGEHFDTLELEEWRLTFQKIEWEWKDPKTSFADDWQASP
jgi:type VI secretion system secreted protein Hcp